MFKKLKERFMKFFGYTRYVRITNDDTSKVWIRKWSINWSGIKLYVINKLKRKDTSSIQIRKLKEFPNRNVRFDINNNAIKMDVHIREQIIKEAVKNPYEYTVARSKKIGEIDRSQIKNTKTDYEIFKKGVEEHISSKNNTSSLKKE